MAANSSSAVRPQVVSKSSNGGGARGRCAYGEDCVEFNMPSCQEQCSGCKCQNYVHQGCHDHHFNSESESSDNKEVYCKGCKGKASTFTAAVRKEKATFAAAVRKEKDIRAAFNATMEIHPNCEPKGKKPKGKNEVSKQTKVETDKDSSQGQQLVSQPQLVEMTTKNKVGQEFCIMYGVNVDSERLVIPYFGTVTSIYNRKGNIVVTCQWKPFHSYEHPDKEDPLVICQKDERDSVSVALENWNKGFDMESSWIMGNKSDFAKLCPSGLRDRFKVRICLLYF